jgi:hypothetical protein
LYSFHLPHRLGFLAFAPEFGDGFGEQRRNSRAVSKNCSRRARLAANCALLVDVLWGLDVDHQKLSCMH